MRPGPSDTADETGADKTGAGTGADDSETGAGTGADETGADKAGGASSASLSDDMSSASIARLISSEKSSPPAGLRVDNFAAPKTWLSILAMIFLMRLVSHFITSIFLY